MLINPRGEIYQGYHQLYNCSRFVKQKCYTHVAPFSEKEISRFRERFASRSNAENRKTVRLGVIDWFCSLPLLFEKISRLKVEIERTPSVE